jgi:RimJ/RimL family protein N-acetyltransferase
MNYILETKRLKLREFQTDDAQFIIELLNSEGWLQFIGDRNIKTMEQAINYLENGPIKSYRVNGYGLWLIEIKEDSRPIGMCGIINRDSLDTPDIGYALLPEFFRFGYGFEIADATLTYAKDQLKISNISAITTPINTRSIRLLEKIGLKFNRTILFGDENEELLLYCI